MNNIDLKRRLAVILAADAANYSRLMAVDDRATVTALDQARTIFRKQIETNEGRVIDMTGDSVLAVFDTVTGAVSAALSVQDELDRASSEAPEDRRMRFRIGLHMGDVIEKPDGSLYGDAVNIAARLEQLAEPGAVMISDAVHGMVRDRISADFEDSGEHRVKNIRRPVHAFRVGLQVQVPTPSAAPCEPIKSAPGDSNYLIDEDIEIRLPKQHSIAVQAFSNMSDTKTYNKTAKGRAMLRSGTAGFSRAQTSILEAIDGKGSLAALTEAMTALERKAFLNEIVEFERQGLIRQLIDTKEFDLPGGVVEVTELGPQESVRAWAEATRGTQELKEHGFYTNPAKSEPTSPVGNDGSLRVLVVDDDESIVSALTMLLEDKGHVVVSALDAQGAVAELRKPVAPDLVLLDVQLPGHNGFDILMSIRKNERLSKVPVIMVTGMIGSDQVMKGLKYGADGYIFKPFEWKALYDCIQAVTGC